MIHFVTPVSADWTVREYLSRWGLPVADRIRIEHYETLFQRERIQSGSYVLSALCMLSPEERTVLENLCERLAGAQSFRFLNHPTRSLRRLGLIEELARLGWNEFRAVRATGDFEALRYPVFLRAERTHDGALSPLLRSRREVEAAIGRALLRGRRLDDLLVVEFCDTSDERGYYRKYSAYVVGDRILPRSVECGRAWMMKHSQSDFTRAILEEERAYVVENPHRDQLARIFSVARVDYGRIDYAVKDGRVQTWEINLLPTIGRGPGESKALVPPELLPYREETKAIFYRGFQEAWAAVDLPMDGWAPGPVSEAGASGPTPAAGAPKPSILTRTLHRVPARLRRAARRVLAPIAAPLVGRRALRRARAEVDPGRVP
ncbi:MAG TPA: hypothetical protein VMQ61_05655 [Thermoanaerobaculia bacterium]|nr:hypothetical protein [Thermoanaerobaculia bacterium]